MKLIVGLGNPGDQYASTRHNIGFLALDALAARHGLVWQENRKLAARVAKDGGTVYAAPLTFMNDSGRAVRAVMAYYGLLPKTLGLFTTRDADLADTLTVIHDDLDLPFGSFKVSVDSRSAGHRGVQSVIDHLKTKNFRRIRVGIKPPAPSPIPAEKYVLQRMNDEERRVLTALLRSIAGDPVLWE